MIETLFNPKSIVVVGGSNNLDKPGGAILQNILKSNFGGSLYVVNPQNEKTQGCKTFKSVQEIDFPIDLAILAIPAQHCLEATEWLVAKCSLTAVIILSAGFSETSEDGKALELKLIEITSRNNVILLGPNCIGAITPYYAGVFTKPAPKTNQNGIDFLTSSGATATFLIEAGLKRGLQLNSLFSVGNGNQTGIEEILEYLDSSFNSETSSKTKIIYLESLKNPQKLLDHASSLIKKGCRIAAIKSGTSNAGSRAAQSHTGAMINADIAVEALFKKAGIIRCIGREQLLNTANILLNKPLYGNKFVIITHAGGPAVMLTDTLENGGFTIPTLDISKTSILKAKLHKGSSVSNPIDFLATGTPAQLDDILNYCRSISNEIDGIITIFGSPGLGSIKKALAIISKHQKNWEKPIYAILPSIINTSKEIEQHIKFNLPIFNDEVEFGKALTNTYSIYSSRNEQNKEKSVNHKNTKGTTNLSWKNISDTFEKFNIPLAKQAIINSDSDLYFNCEKVLSYPLVMKATEINHKSDIGAVKLNITNMEEALMCYKNLSLLNSNKGVIIQEMLSGSELFIGAKYEPNFGHLVICGIGGIFVEIYNDFASRLIPVSKIEALEMIEELKGKAIFNGIRGNNMISKEVFANLIVSVSNIVLANTSIIELDINPLIATPKGIFAVDGRITVSTTPKT